MKKINLVFVFLLLVVSTFSQFNLEDLWLNRKYSPKTVSGFMPTKSGELYSITDEGNIDAYSYKTGKMVKTLVKSSELIPAGQSKPIDFSDYTFNSDETKVLLTTAIERVYRHSFKADYYVFDLITKKLTRLSNNGKQQLASFSSDGKKVAFVRDNNLFYVDLTNGNEKQITNDGKMNEIINGAPDWVYEEEFSFSQAFYWSPDDANIAFIRFDESKVKEFELTYSGKLYPEVYKYKYPKAGESNSLVKVMVYNLASAKTNEMNIGNETDIYIPRIYWANSNQLAVLRLNRLQNKLEMLFANPANGESKIIYTEENKSYIEITDNLQFLPNNLGFVIVSEKDGYNHIYQYDMNGKLVKQLTSGKWDVFDILGFDAKTANIFFTSAESSPINKELYKVNLKSGKKEKMSKKAGTYAIEFSSDFSYYFSTFTDANTPPYCSMHNAKGEELYVLENNQAMLDMMKSNKYSPKEFFTFKTEEGIELNAWMIKPFDFDSSKRYPVLMYVYGGPNSQTVQNMWGWYDLFWYQILAQKGYIIVSVDGRGTGGRGEEFRKCTYMQLGKFETMDQIEGAKYLAKQSFVDGKRIGIFGWSYGGYMSTLCMTKGANYFKTGIAVAPVTNWRYYDNIYTERYMRTPQENANGYDDNSPISHVEKMKGKYLLVHGMTDDNVHVQNSVDLVNKLVSKNIQFEMQFYPNNDHGIRSGRNTRYHLYNRMTNFLLENL